MPKPAVVELSVSSTAAWNISPYLASMSLVYAWAPDAAYGNGTMAQWARSHHINTARYPAGMASCACDRICVLLALHSDCLTERWSSCTDWNWEAPSGMMGVSSLDPSAPPPAPSEDWMSLAEYLKLCKTSGMVPLIGVNYNCHNYQKCNETKEQTIPRAVRQVEFVLQQGFPGAFW